MVSQTSRQKASGARTSAGNTTCSICSGSFSAKGFSTHYRSCAAAAETRRVRAQRKKQATTVALSVPVGSTSRVDPVQSTNHVVSESVIGSLCEPDLEMHGGGQLAAANTEPTEPLVADNDDIVMHQDNPIVPPPPNAELGTQVPTTGTHVRIQYHPSSKRADKICTIDEYLASRTVEGHPEDNEAFDQSAHSANHRPPWFPFKSQGDFDFAECAHDCRWTNSQIDDMLRRMRNIWCKGGKVDVSFQSHRDVHGAMEAMRESGVKFMTRTSSASYNDYSNDKVTIEFEYQICPLLEVIRDVIRDPALAPHIEWFPTRRFIIVDGKEQPFIDDVDCTSDWWNIQSLVAKVGGIYVPMMIYSDGTQAYRFGGPTGKNFHPIILRLPFLPSCIRNSTRKGGGVLVGWMPQIVMPATEKSSVSFTDFKNKVIHIVLADLLSSIRISSQIGEPIVGLDNIRRSLHIGVLQVSADFEEATVFALTRGVNALAPCPMCLVPNTEMNLITTKYPLRTQEQSIQIYKKTEPLLRKYGSIGVAENILKQHGLRPVCNAFWSVHYSDIHRAMAYDIGHGIDGGIAKRLINGVVNYLSNSTKDRVTQSKIDDRFSSLRPWGRWVHLEKVTEVSYVDQRTWHSILMRLAGVVWDLECDGRRGMKHVLVCIRALAQLRCVLGIHFVLEEHIKLAEQFAKDFADSLPAAARVLNVEFNIPKVHLLLHHAIDHIRRKGPLKDIGTMLGEHGHVEVHGDFEQVGGFESEKQVTKLRETRIMMQVIRERVDEYQSESQSTNPDPEDPSSLQNQSAPRKKKAKAQLQQPVLGSPQHKFPAWELDHIEAALRSARSVAFRNSRQELLAFLKEQSGEATFPLIGNNGDIQPYNSIQLCYGSFSTRLKCWEFVRCAESFRNRIRYDCALIETPGGHYFARVQGLYACVAFKQTWSVARVTKFKPITNNPRATLREINHPHVREEQSGTWIKASWITRFVYEQPTFEHDKPNEYFINNYMDSDMFLRLLALG